MSDAAFRAQAANLRLFFGLCAAISISVLVPILLAGRLCNDDLARSVVGSYGWVDNGRYLSNVLMRALELGASREVDIAPIPQLLAVLALAYAGVLLVRRFAITSLPLGILVALPLGTQPFFLQNLSYRFDSVTMATALLCCVGAVAMRNRRWNGWLWGSVALLASFNLYQPAFNVFLVLVVFELAFEITQECPTRALVRLAGFRFLQAAVACIAYKLFFTTGIKDWVAGHGEMIHSVDALPVVGTNALKFLGYMRDALGARIASILLIATILAALPMIALALRRLWRDQKLSMLDRWLRSIILMFWPALGLLAAIGPMLLLVDPVFAPRVFPAIGALIAAALISAAHAAQRVERLRPIPYVTGGACLIVSSITAGVYSSASSEQTAFEDRIASTMQDDLAQLKTSTHLSNYVLVGSAGYAPATQHAISQFPLAGQLIGAYLTQDSFFTKSYLLHFRQPLTLLESNRLSESQKRAALDACTSPVVITRSAFRIRLVDDLAVVDFRDPAPCGK
jgi:hypothetical protein